MLYVCNQRKNISEQLLQYSHFINMLNRRKLTITTLNSDEKGTKIRQFYKENITTSMCTVCLYHIPKIILCSLPSDLC